LINVQSIVKAVLYDDGDFVLYDDDGKLKWSTGTKSNGPSILLLQNDGNLVLIDQSKNILWTTNTSAECTG